jgi:hypothetical protein
MSTYQSGVIACHSITTTRPEAIHPKSSTLKAWPGIKEWNRYCVLPTVGALYRPDVLLNPTDVASVSLPPGWTLKKIMEEVIRWFPTPEQFMSEVMPMFEEHFQALGEYYQSHFGIEYDKQRFQQALANALTSLNKLNDVSVSNGENSLSNENFLSIFARVDGGLSIEEMYSILIFNRIDGLESKIAGCFVRVPSVSLDQMKCGISTSSLR